MQNINRKHPGLVYKISFLFAFVAVFTFLALKLPHNSSAASLDNFRPGNIISDYTMSNYQSMTVEEIDQFLHNHGNCNNRDTYKADWYPSVHYHVEDGHFVCLADERFAASGTNYGDLLKEGEESQTAAEIIYEIANTYKINPQVLIVLLEKEQGLISDSWPNSLQYRSATGFGCPDTAPCDSQYYGLKNQLESAAWLFRTVLDGGWTNYPIGENYIRYNPNASCGGSVVYIENLATSALYRYTPYQPNAAALAAGYGTVSCGAYGNRNFYLFFEDWFGGITDSYKSIKMPDGNYYIQSKLLAEKVVDVEAGLALDGTNVRAYDKNDTDAQKWSIKYNKSTDDYTIINLGAKKALDVDAASKEDGANIQIWESNSTCAQRWKIIAENDNIKLLSACSYKPLSVEEQDPNNIIITSGNGSDAQKWSLLPIDEIEEGLYIISSALNTNRVLDLNGGANRAKNGTNIQIWTKNHTAAQRWFIKKTNDGYFTIENLASSKSIDVNGAGTANGTNVQAWTDNSTCAQKWQIVKTDDYYTFISACGQGVLDLVAAKTSPGTNIQIYEPNNTKAQKWELKKVDIIENGEYTITSKLSGKKAIDINGNIKKDGTNVQIYESNGTSAQKWQIEYDEKTDYYTIYNKGADRVIDVEAAGKVNNTNIHIWSRNNTCAQKWTIANIDDDYVFFSACSGLALDVEAGNPRNGTNIQLYEFNNTKAQRWALTSLDE